MPAVTVVMDSVIERVIIHTSRLYANLHKDTVPPVTMIPLVIVAYTTLSRQTIERSTTPMLNTALAALRNAYAKATENKVRSFLYDTIAADRKSTRLNSSHNVASRMPSSA